MICLFGPALGTAVEQSSAHFSLKTLHHRALDNWCSHFRLVHVRTTPVRNGSYGDCFFRKLSHNILEAGCAIQLEMLINDVKRQQRRQFTVDDFHVDLDNRLGGCPSLGDGAYTLEFVELH